MEKIVDYFLHGMMDEVQTGKSFEFSDAEKAQFVQDINLFLRENSGFVAYTLGFDPALLSDELSNEFNRSMFLRLSDNLLNLLLENNSILLCLLLTAKARPYLTANFDNHAYNLLVMEMVMLQRKQEMPGVGYLLQSIDLHPLQIGFQKKLAKVACLGVGSDEVCEWIVKHWELCIPYASDISFFLDESRGNAQKLLWQLINSESKK